MKVRFRTNLDQYRQIAWPELDYKPAVGETVSVHPGSETLCKTLGIPKRLEIVDITHDIHGVMAELWYKKIDVEIAQLDGTMNKLMGQ